MMTMAGRRSGAFLEPVPRLSITTLFDTPVFSSATSRTVTPKTRSSYFTMPSTSVSTGSALGFHSARRSPRLTVAPSSTFRRAP